MRYDAFLSYSHAGDAELAASIQSSLQRFARPWYKTYALRVFRDKTSLAANPALWNSIVSALEKSEYLLLLASPHAAASEWVNQEVAWFLKNRTPEKVLIVITGGQIAWSAAAGEFDWSQTTALPPVLRGSFRLEPLYVDLSWAHQAQFRHDARFRDAILDLAAPLHGRPKDELDSEDLRQHRRTLRIAWSAVALLSMLAVALGLAAVYATRQRNVAQEQTAVAKEQRSRAEEQAHIAEQQRQLAEDRRMTALSRQLAAQAAGDTSLALDGALLEAVEAFRLAPTFEARQALLEVLFYSPHLRRFLRGPQHVWRTAALSRDGGTVVALDDDSGTVVIETATEKSLEKVGEWNGRGKVKSVAVSADGRFFVIGEPGRVVIRSVKTPAAESFLADGLDSGGAPAVLSFSPDRKLVAAYESSPGVLIWDAASHRLRVPPLRPKRWENALAFSPDGAVLASGGRDGSIVLWTTATGQPIGSPLLGHRAEIFGLAFSPDGAMLASGSEDRTVILWDVKTGRALGTPLAGHEKWPLGHDSWGLSVTFSPDGRTLASAAKDRSVILWDVASRNLAGILKGHAAPPMAVAFSADGRSLLSLGRDNAALRWASDPLSVLGTPLGAGGDGVSSVAFSPDGRTLATAGMEHSVTLWDAERGRPVRAALRGQSNYILSVAFAADGARLLSGAKDRVVEWELNRGTARASRLTGTADAVSQIAFSPDGNYMTWSDGSELLVRTGKDAPAVRLPIARASADHTVMGLAFSPDGRRLASGGFDGTVALWDVSRRQLVWPAARAHRMSVQALAFSPDGKILASAALGTADFDGSVRLWDTQSGRELPPALTGHSGPVRALGFSPDGKMLACAAGPRIVFWDIERRQSLGEAIAGNSTFVTSLAFSADGRWLGTGGYDDGAIVWDLRPEVWRRQACAIANRNLDEREWKRLIGDNTPYQPSCP